MKQCDNDYGTGVIIVALVNCQKNVCSTDKRRLIATPGKLSDNQYTVAAGIKPTTLLLGKRGSLQVANTVCGIKPATFLLGRRGSQQVASRVFGIELATFLVRKGIF